MAFSLHGVHVPHRKNTADTSAKRLPSPTSVTIPMSMHIGKPAIPCVKVGDSVYSSGVGSIYPADLRIGTVTALGLDEYSRTLVATVKPAVDFSDLRYMMIITGYDS